MWIADQWKDYEIIDTSKGEKLERWGNYLLVRPDPQVIWDTPKIHKGWKHMNGHYHRSKKGGGEWEFFNLPEQWTIQYKSLTFNLKPFSFKHTGLFPEQAANWDWFSEKIKNAGRPIKVLNLFAYTGGATLAAAAAGAAGESQPSLGSVYRHGAAAVGGGLSAAAAHLERRGRLANACAQLGTLVAGIICGAWWRIPCTTRSCRRRCCSRARSSARTRRRWRERWWHA